MRSLKHILDIPSHTNNMAMYSQIGLLPLDLYRQILCASYAIRLYTIENNARESYHKESQNTVISYKNSIHTLPAYVKEVFSLAGTTPQSVCSVSIPPRPPWTLKSAIINLEIPKISKKDLPHIQRTTTLEYLMHTFPSALTIYTDGSKLNTDQVGGGYVIPPLHKTAYFNLNKECSIYTAELVAISLTLQHLLALTLLQIYQILLCSDSQTALRAIAFSDRYSRPEIISDIKFFIHQLLVREVDTTLQWIPSHVGIHGNDLADKAAKLGPSGAPGSIKILLAPAPSELKLKKKNSMQSILTTRLNHLATKFPNIPVFSTKKPPLSYLSSFKNSVIHRLFTDSWWVKYSHPTCLCGEDFDPQHVLLFCSHFADDCADLRNSHPNANSPSTLLLNSDAQTLSQISAATRNPRLAALL